MFCKSSIKKERWPIIGSCFLRVNVSFKNEYSIRDGRITSISTWVLIIRPLSHAHSLNSPGSLSCNLGTFDLSSIESIPRMARRKIKRFRRKWAAHNFEIIVPVSCLDTRFPPPGLSQHSKSRISRSLWWRVSSVTFTSGDSPCSSLHLQIRSTFSTAPDF